MRASGAVGLWLGACILLAHAHRGQAARPQQQNALPAAELIEAPDFTDSYTVKYIYSLPHTAKIQKDGIRYPVTFWRDALHSRVRLDTYDGVNSIISKKGLEYEIVPRVDKHHCFVWEGGDDSQEETGAMPQALPDVRGWDFVGNEVFNGQQARLWLYQQKHGAKHVDYKFFVGLSGTPLRLHMVGMELMDRAHYDEWVLDFIDYEPGPPDPAVFETPSLCHGVKPSPPLLGLRHSVNSLRMWSLVPSVKYAGDPKYDAFLATHGRTLRSLPEYHMRAEILRTSAAMIDAHNAANKSFSLSLNRFGDWTKEEFAAMMLPNRSRTRRSRNAAKSAYEIPHKPLTEPTRVPRSVDWRGTGADGPVVKDQANCGSCWTFAATGALEAAHFLSTGQKVSFSEQELVDCSWDFGVNLGCNGGDAEAAIEYVAATGGIAVTDEYEYRGQDGFCRANATRRVGKFKGFSRIPAYNDALVKEALYTRGPLAISIYCDLDTFKFYSGGVYNDLACLWQEDDLDHAVVLVGYGTSKEGDWWLVRNSWSDLWGDRGYIRISRDNHGCGVPGDALYAVVDGAAP